MWLRRLEADRLRNLQAIALDMPAGLTFVVGRNGQGKSSLLEAAYLLGTGRSFRTRRHAEIVCRDGGPLRVAGTVSSRQGDASLCVVIDPPERRLLIDKAEKDQETYLGRLDVVDLTAQRMLVVKGGPEERRRFLDRGVVGLQPAYLRTLGEYRQVLEQRNALLRGAGQRLTEGLRREIGAWDQRLVVAGERVHRGRSDYARRLERALGTAAPVLFPDGERLTVRYCPSPTPPGSPENGGFEQRFGEVLRRRRGRDLGLGFTSEGPHRDELSVELSGVDLRRFGSAGQLRAAMITLKLAKLAILREDRGETPLFLMDDFDSDVDEERATRLAGFLHGGEFQTIAATSKESMADRFDLPLRKVRMEDGLARPL